MTTAVPPSAQRRVLDAVRTGRMLNEDATRAATCECGALFTQTQISAEFFTMLERHAASWGDAFAAQVPDGYLPVFCPPCERIDIGRHAEMAAHRREMARVYDRDGREVA